jgi:hypothetical protein
VLGFFGPELSLVISLGYSLERDFYKKNPLKFAIVASDQYFLRCFQLLYDSLFLAIRVLA